MLLIDTVRIGVLSQTFAAGVNFYKNKLLNLKSAVSVAITITIDSIIGAKIAIEINQNILKNIIAFAMLIVLFMIFFKPEKWLTKKSLKIKYKYKF